MNQNRPNRRRKGFTLIEVLVVLLILGVLMSIALPAYISSVFSSRESVANGNAKSLAIAIQSKAVTQNSYDTTLADYAQDMGGALPMNPCTGTTTGYTITATAVSATVVAGAGSSCGTWTPTTYLMTL